MKNVYARVYVESVIIEYTYIYIHIHILQGNGSSTQMYLEKFLKTIETYFYPANFGRWMGKLKELLVKLPYHFIIRLHVYVNF